jgi:two-component system, response regulator PdtaR
MVFLSLPGAMVARMGCGRVTYVPNAAPMPELVGAGERIASSSGSKGKIMALFARRARHIQRLLIVEDEPLVAFDNEHVLSSAGYTIVGTVDRGDAAIALLNGGAVDAVVLDVSLAGAVSGLDVAGVAAERGIAVLFVTGDCPSDARHLALGCLAKPYRPANLVAAIVAIDQLAQGQVVETVPAGLTLFRESVIS